MPIGIYFRTKKHRENISKALQLDIDEIELKRLYCDEQFSCPDIAKIMGCSGDTVYYRLKRMRCLRSQPDSMRTIKSRGKISKAQKGIKETPLACLHNSEVRKANKNPNYGKYGKNNPLYGKPRPDSVRMAISLAKMGHNVTGSTRNILSKSIKALWQNEDSPYYRWTPTAAEIEKIGNLYKKGKNVVEVSNMLYGNQQHAGRIYGIVQGLGIMRSLSEIVSRYWEDIPKTRRVEMLKDFMITGQKAALEYRRPTGAEQKMINLLGDVCPNEYKYSGNGIVKIGTLYPDFININGKKKVIEVFGNHWHRGENPQDKISQYKEYGFDCLVIWESELKDDDLTQRIKIFNGLPEK